MKRECLNCGCTFEKKQNESMTVWVNKRKYCSKECSDKDRVGKKIHSEKMKKKFAEHMKGNKYTLGVEPWNKGKKNWMSDEAMSKLKSANTGENSHKWKGDKASRRSIHLWVERQLGKASNGICELCNKKQARDWSNKDHKYKRDLKDWQRACSRCHQHFDMKYNGKYKNRCKKI